jgi:hypothetical protein
MVLSSHGSDTFSWLFGECNILDVATWYHLQIECKHDRRVTSLQLFFSNKTLLLLLQIVAILIKVMKGTEKARMEREREKGSKKLAGCRLRKSRSMSGNFVLSQWRFRRCLLIFQRGLYKLYYLSI